MNGREHDNVDDDRARYERLRAAFEARRREYDERVAQHRAVDRRRMMQQRQQQQFTRRRPPPMSAAAADDDDDVDNGSRGHDRSRRRGTSGERGQRGDGNEEGGVDGLEFGEDCAGIKDLESGLRCLSNSVKDLTSQTMRGIQSTTTFHRTLRDRMQELEDAIRALKRKNQELHDTKDYLANLGRQKKHIQEELARLPPEGEGQYRGELLRQLRDVDAATDNARQEKQRLQSHISTLAQSITQLKAMIRQNSDTNRSEQRRAIDEADNLMRFTRERSRGMDGGGKDMKGGKEGKGGRRSRSSRTVRRHPKVKRRRQPASNHLRHARKDKGSRSRRGRLLHLHLRGHHYHHRTTQRIAEK